mmetsp:Transcript_1494/g.2052  ORF Transcript_1494/g.2052 Transcript_1494/m.2052 type:complete len:316 (-) Transcript_1494:207-1154(-)|eukprot:CAMPEP_0184486656 /NCGR_PEP_ID=MMETSP0113_2-20130426/8136_1 /TAXON_ID=91329 /ORGANISM="Norrisiella sphaerica, Strain BC52" /LENGTH=315 /DNA_ID=CAMNT_0026868637 /DNA_START=78 /DNA_END=1025 /DNA_ORIENTATION=+
MSENKVLDATIVAKPYLDDIQASVKKNFPNGKAPKLVGILANEDPFAKMYAKWTRKACERVGLRYETVEVKRTELEDKVYDLNEDKDVHGMMVYYPVFGTLPSFMAGVSMDSYISNCVDYKKDVEGMCFTYIQALYKNKRTMTNKKGEHVKSILPCTPLAVVKILEHLGAYDSKQKLAGKTITVINRSQIVGHPLAAMLANDGALVYSKDIDSMFLFKKDEKGRGRLCETQEKFDDVLQRSAIVISGVPSKGYKVNVDQIQDGTIFVNVASHENVDRELLFKKKKGITYVPKVGKVTVAMLQRNLLRLYNGYAKE